MKTRPRLFSARRRLCSHCCGNGFTIDARALYPVGHPKQGVVPDEARRACRFCGGQSAAYLETVLS